MHSTKQNIIDTSIKLFAKQGYEETTIEDIIQETDLSKGGVYHHFDSKEAIADSIIQQYMEGIYEYYSKRESECQSALVKLNLFSEAKQKASKGKKRGIKAILLGSGNELIQSKIKEKNEQMFKPLMIEILKEGKKSGEFKLRSAEVAADILFCFQDMIVNLPPHILKNSRKFKPYKDEIKKLFYTLLGIHQKHVELHKLARKKIKI